MHVAIMLPLCMLPLCCHYACCHYVAICMLLCCHYVAICMLLCCHYVAICMLLCCHYVAICMLLCCHYACHLHVAIMLPKHACCHYVAKPRTLYLKFHLKSLKSLKFQNLKSRKVERVISKFLYTSNHVKIGRTILVKVTNHETS